MSSEKSLRADYVLRTRTDAFPFALRRFRSLTAAWRVGTHVEVVWTLEMMQRPMRLTDRLAHPMLKRGHDRTLTQHRSSTTSQCPSSEGAAVPEPSRHGGSSKQSAARFRLTPEFTPAKS